MVLKYKDGDLMNEKKIVLNEAQKMLVEKNLSIVQIVINKFMRNIQGDNITPDYSKEDAIQDGYLALCKAAFTFDYGKNIPFEGYATTVVHNYVYSQMQKYFKKKVSSLDDILNAFVREECDELFCCETKEFLATVNRLINEREHTYNAKVPHAYDVFKMRTVHGLKNKDIAQILNISVSDVSYKYTLAKSDIRRYASIANIAC